MTECDIRWLGNKTISKKFFDILCPFYIMASRFLSSLRLKDAIKQVVDLVFVICKIITVSVRVISLASADNCYLDIDNSKDDNNKKGQSRERRLLKYAFPKY